MRCQALSQNTPRGRRRKTLRDTKRIVPILEDHVNTEQQVLIGRLKKHVLTPLVVSSDHFWSRQCANPAVALTDLVHAEALLGFPLPSLLKRIYTEVGNGGFGPGYGLFPLINEEDSQTCWTDSLVTTYLMYRALTPEQFAEYWDEKEDEYRLQAWPEKLIMICDWGCNIYSYLDCSQPECPVLHLDHNLPVRKLELEASSLHQWLENWLTKGAPGKAE